MGSRILKHVDFERANALLEDFNKATGFVTAIVDLDGNILSKSGWRNICTDFHRVNAGTACNCTISDTELASKLEEGKKYHFYKCINGMIDVSVPIVIRNEHIANLFSGQFFFEEPDVSFFKKQAQKYGFDEKLYLEALSKVPVVSPENVELVMGLLLNITQTIIEMTADKLDQIDLIEELNKRESALMESQTQLRQTANDLLESQRIAHVGTWKLDLATNQVKWSEELYKMYGFDPSYPPPPYTEHMKLFTPESWNKLSTALEKTRTIGTPYELELETMKKDGLNGWMWVRGEANKDQSGEIVSLWGAAQDISDRKTVMKQLNDEAQLLEKQVLLFNSLLEVLPIGVFMAESESGRPLIANRAASELLGRGVLPDATTGNLSQVYEAYKNSTNERYPADEMPITLGMKDITSHVDDMLVRRPDGTGRLLEVWGTPVKNSGGIVWASLVAFLDITERKQMEMQLRESEERFAMLFQQAPLGYQSLDEQGYFLEVNQKWLDTFGYETDEVIGKWFGDFLAPEYRDLFRTRFPIFKAQGYIHSEFEMIGKFGDRMFIAFDGKIGHEKDGSFRQTHCILKDITSERAIARELERNKKLTEATLASVGDAVMSTDIYGCIQFLNPVAEKLTGWTQEEARGLEIEKIFDIQNELTGIKSESIARLVLETGNIEGLANHTVLISRQGERHPIEDCAAPIIMESGEICGVVIVFSDCTAKRERLQEIEFLSYHDSLTGLYNRRFFEEEMRRNDVSRNLPISIIMADINGLKQINDSFGHTAGDELLRTAAQIIKRTCRADDIVARLGGDEFVILLPKTSAYDTDLLVKRIKTELQDEQIMGIPISLSFGYETKSQEQETIYGVLNLAEDHMYRHKLSEASSIKSKNVELIINALYAKNQREMHHSLRVAEYSSQISRALGQSADEINQVKMAGLLHDIGKIGISDEILNKPERLNDKELEETRKHCEIGFRILKASPDFAEVANFVFEHQEKWDGTGYPRGIAGNEISQAARIIAIADAFDAMTGERTYGRVHSKQEAASEIMRCAGTQFDPEIADLFVEHVLGQLSDG